MRLISLLTMFLLGLKLCSLDLMAATDTTAASSDLSKSLSKPSLQVQEQLWAKVIDASGNVVAGAELEFWHQKKGAASEVIRRKSDERGRVFWSNPSSRDSFMICRHPDAATFARCHVVPSKHGGPENPMSIQMESGSEMSIQLVDPKGRPMPGLDLALSVWVKAHEKTCSHVFPRFEVARSDEQGWVRFPQMKEMSFGAELISPGFSFGNKPGRRYKKGKTLKMKVLSAEPVDLSFVHEDGSPLPKAQLQVAYTKKVRPNFGKLKNYHSRMLVADDRGNIRIWAPKDHYLQLLFHSEDYIDRELLNHETKALSELRVVVAREGVIAGRVLDQVTGQPISGAIVEGTRIERKSRQMVNPAYVKSEKNGNFRLKALSHDIGSSIRVMHRLYDVVRMEASGDQNTVRMKPSARTRYRLTQQVPHSEPALLAHHALVVSLYGLRGTIGQHKIKTDANGEFDMGLDTEGEMFDVLVEGMKSKRVTLQASEEVQNIVLEPSRRFELTLMDKNGVVCNYPSVHLITETEKGPYFRAKSIGDQKGRYLVSGLPTGPQKLRVRVSGYKEVVLDVVVENHGGQVDVKLERAHRLIIRPEGKGPLPKTLLVRFEGGGGFDRITARWESKDYRLWFNGDPTQSIHLSIEGQGYLKQEMAFPKGLPKEPIVFHLKKGLVQTIVVKDALGSPIEAARVSLSRLEGGHRSSSIRKNSDALGQVVFTGLEEGRHELQVAAVNYAPYRKEVNFHVGGEPLNIKLDGEASLILSVVDESFEVVQNAKLKIRRFEKRRQYWHEQRLSQYRISINAKGGRDIRGLPEGRYILSASHKTKGLGESEIIDLKVGESRSLEVQLKLAASMEGIVVDAEGQPLAKVRLSANYQGEQARSLQYIHANSDADGKFVLAPIPLDKKVNLSASLKGYELKGGQQVVEPGTEHKTLTMIRERLLYLDVVSPEGLRVDEPELMLEDAYGNSFKLYGVQGRGANLVLPTQHLKPYLQHGLDYRILAKAKGYSPGRSDVLTSMDGGARVRIQLKAEQVIKFLVVDTSGVPIPKVQVYQGHRPRRAKPALAVSDDQGLISLEQADAKEQTYVFIHPRFAAVNIKATGQASGEWPTRVVLEAGRRLTVSVKDALGAPVSGVNIDGYAIGATYERLNGVTTDAKGEVTFSHLKKGNYQIGYSRDEMSSLRGMEMSKTIEITGEEHQTVAFVLPHDEDLGELVVTWPESLVGIESVTLSSRTGLSRYGVIQSGRVSFKNLLPGEYQIMAMGVQMIKRDAKVEAGQITELKLEVGHYEVQGRVQLPDGSPAGVKTYAVVVRWSKERDPEVMNPTAMMAQVEAVAKIQNGSFKLNLSSHGQYRLMITSGHKATGPLFTAPFEVSEGMRSAPLDLGSMMLPRGQALEGRILDSSGAPVEGVVLQVYSQGEIQWGMTIRSNASGKFKISHAPLFPFEVKLSKSGHSSREFSIHSVQDLDLIFEGSPL